MSNQTAWGHLRDYDTVIITGTSDWPEDIRWVNLRGMVGASGSYLKIWPDSGGDYDKTNPKIANAIDYDGKIYFTDGLEEVTLLDRDTLLDREDEGNNLDTWEDT